MQKCSEHCLLDLAKLYASRLSFDIPRLCQFAFENPSPLLFLAFVLLRRRDIRQFPCRLGNVCLVRCTQEDVRANEWALVPLFGMAQRQSKRPQYASRALKTFQVRPFGVEDIGQVRVKGIALEEMVLGDFTGLAGLFVEISNTLQRGDNVGAKHVTSADGLWRKEAAAQHFSHIFLDDRLHALLALAAEDCVQLIRQLFTQCIALAWIGGQQRCHDGAAIHFGHRLGEILEEIDEPSAPRGVKSDFLASIH